MRATTPHIRVLVTIDGDTVYNGPSQLDAFKHLKGWVVSKTGTAKMLVITLKDQVAYYFKRK